MCKLLIFGFVILMLPFYPAIPQEEKPAETPKAACCFERAGYQGTCVVQPSQEETCESILKYLNTPATVGKNYCGATKLRGGWKSVDCPEQEESAH